MKKRIVIIFIILLLFSGCSVYLMENLCGIGVKCPNCPQTSTSQQASVNEKLFIGYYLPVQQKYKLKYYEDVLMFDTMWYEHGWYINSDVCLLKHRVITKDYNFVFRIIAGSEDFNWNLFVVADSTQAGLGTDVEHKNYFSKEIRLHSCPDTLQFIIEERNQNPDIGWKEPIKCDTVTYVKLKP